MSDLLILFAWVAYLMIWLWVIGYTGKKQKRHPEPAMLVPMPGLDLSPVLSYREWLNRYCEITGMLPGFDLSTYLYQQYLEHHTVAVKAGEP